MTISSTYVCLPTLGSPQDQPEPPTGQGPCPLYDQLAQDSRFDDLFDRPPRTAAPADDPQPHPVHAHLAASLRSL